MRAARASVRSARPKAAAPGLAVAHAGFRPMLGAGRGALPSCLLDLPGLHVRPVANAHQKASATPPRLLAARAPRAMRPAAPEHARTEAASHALRRAQTERACGLPGQALAPRAPELASFFSFRLRCPPGMRVFYASFLCCSRKSGGWGGAACYPPALLLRRVVCAPPSQGGVAPPCRRWGPSARLVPFPLQALAASRCGMRLPRTSLSPAPGMTAFTSFTKPHSSPSLAAAPPFFCCVHSLLGAPKP